MTDGLGINNYQIARGYLDRLPALPLACQPRSSRLRNSKEYFGLLELAGAEATFNHLDGFEGKK